MLDGVQFNIGGVPFTVPPLGLKALRRLGPKLELLDQMGQRLPKPEEIDAIVEVIHSALVRNYPELTPELVLEMLDVGNMGDLLLVVCGASGLTRKEANGSGGVGGP